MKPSARLVLALLASSVTAASMAAAQTVIAPTAFAPSSRPTQVRAFRAIVGHAVPSVPPVAACVPLREVSLGHGASSLTLAPASANACAPAAPIARGSTAQETLRIRVRSRVAAVFTSPGGALQLFNESGTSVALQTAVGACGAGLHVGSALLSPGVYVLRAPGTAGGARTVSVEAVALRGDATVERPGATETALNTAGGEAGGACDHGDGADVRVLLCPARAATIRAERGALVSMESASSSRTCFSAPAGVATQAAVPPGRLVVLRAFAMGASRGPVTVSLR